MAMLIAQMRKPRLGKANGGSLPAKPSCESGMSPDSQVWSFATHRSTALFTQWG